MTTIIDLFLSQCAEMCGVSFYRVTFGLRAGEIVEHLVWAISTTDSKKITALVCGRYLCPVCGVVDRSNGLHRVQPVNYGHLIYVTFASSILNTKCLKQSLGGYVSCDWA